jgi:hypothetical protein
MCFQNGSHLAEGCTCFQMATSCRMGGCTVFLRNGGYLSNRCMCIQKMAATWRRGARVYGGTWRRGARVSKKWRLPGRGVHVFPKWHRPVVWVHIFPRNGGCLSDRDKCMCFQKWRLPCGWVHMFLKWQHLAEGCTCLKNGGIWRRGELVSK